MVRTIARFVNYLFSMLETFFQWIHEKGWSKWLNMFLYFIILIILLFLIPYLGLYFLVGFFMFELVAFLNKPLKRGQRQTDNYLNGQGLFFLICLFAGFYYREPFSFRFIFELMISWISLIFCTFLWFEE